VSREPWKSPPLPLWAAVARDSDPPTSHAAAKRAPVSEHCRRILEALAVVPAGQSGLSERTGLTIAQVSKRLCDLRRAGAIERDGETVSASGGREARYRRVTHGR
jgi:hypothetical protein